MKKVIIDPFIYSLMALLLCCASCESTLNLEPDVQSGLILASNQFANEVAAEQTIVGLYTRMYASSTYGAQLSIYAALSADELDYRATKSEITQFSSNSLLANNSTIATYWTESYALIEHANAIIEGLNNADSFNATKRNQLLGEAKFIRAFIHFYLVNMFGDVPLITTTYYAVSSQVGRTKSTEVYGQIAQDLTEAEGLLPESYPTEGRVRVNRAVATAMLARVSLYRREWDNAEKKATELINNSAYMLEPDLNSIFLEANNEAIFQLWTTDGYTRYANQVYPYRDPSGDITRDRAEYNITDNFLNSFEQNDKRKQAFTDTMTLQGIVIPFPSKYNIALQFPRGDVNEDDMVLRLAEQYLIRSEARAWQNNITGSLEDLNAIRSRAGLTTLSGLSKDDLLLAIEKERRAELCFEWGHRWFDLKRTGRANSVLSLAKSGWKSSAALYPIPQNEIVKNLRLLPNNEGY